MRCELDGPLARLRFNRPEALNAANWTWVHNLITAMNHLAQSSETHVLSIPAVKEGVVAALGPMRLARLIGAAPAKQLCLLGHRFTAEEGFALRIINEVVPPGSLEEHALALAQELLAIPFTALLHTKHQIDAAFDQDPEALMTELVAAQADCLRSPEHIAVMEEYRQMQARRARERSKEVSG